MYRNSIFIVSASLLLLSGCGKIHTPTVVDIPEEQPAPQAQAEETIEKETDTNSDSSRKEISDMDSPRSGYRQGVVIVKRYVELDPRVYAGEEYADELRADCNAKIVSGEITDECPTNTILRINRPNAQLFPKQLVWSEHNNITNGISRINLGCIDEASYFTAPMRNFTGGFSSVISHEDQKILKDTGEMGGEINIRLSKAAYDIPGRGGTACDIFFTNLKVIKQ